MPDFLTVPHVTWNAVLDILIVAFFIYELLVFIKGTRAVQMALGLGLIIGFFYFSRWVKLETVTWMLTTILNAQARQGGSDVVLLGADAVTPGAKLAAIFPIILWLGAITAGRLVGYTIGPPPA